MAAFTYTQLTVTLDGQVLQTTSGLNGEDVTITDLEGHAVTDERYLGSNSRQYFCQFWPLFFDRPDRTIDAALPMPVRSTSEGFRYLVLALEENL